MYVRDEMEVSRNKTRSTEFISGGQKSTKSNPGMKDWNLLLVNEGTKE
jgi:hypothetical protein